MKPCRMGVGLTADGDMSWEVKLLYAFDLRRMAVDFGIGVLLFFLLGGGKGNGKLL